MSREVPNGSAVMSPANRINPDTTSAAGIFGWDAIAGYYEVRGVGEWLYRSLQPNLTLRHHGTVFVRVTGDKP